MPVELNFKINISTKDGKSLKKEISGEQAENFMRKIISDKIDGNLIGFEGYEFEITGGSDKSGFPMRKGIQFPRKRVLTSKGVGFCGKKRNKGGKQKGLIKRRTVCGERITTQTSQINIKVIKAGAQPLGEAPAEEKK
ncbi:30S ribosomal protein S6e [archaeon]|jgi:small subunit ribosomal protein S6e|nr:30S ribosomal protein S6e [archaeon]MBT3451719.1 30S ribosomal protein S6e [archaeon]MBT6869807.1 30S ribosomal protein S6e [archaeon]MBT7192762.1 30S ribosomal protein S6e [archaeon]MBT7380787.1 30S ribosomal protein S6e [archaeon]